MKITRHTQEVEGSVDNRDLEATATRIAFGPPRKLDGDNTITLSAETRKMIAKMGVSEANGSRARNAVRLEKTFYRHGARSARANRQRRREPR
jgi:hypothetical protein